jgi:hypothetical protein
MRINAVVLLAAVAGLAQAAQPDAKEIIHNSVLANQRDFEADPHYNFKERDRNQNGDKTYQVTMVDGSPYYRVIALNGKPLTSDQERQQSSKEAAEMQKRRVESQSDRQKRIQKYERDRQRDHAMMGQLTIAFNFTLVGQHTVKGRPVWVLRATPKPGYQPTNRDTQVLKGMQGELWIDQRTFQWVRVTAQVIEPVSIEGFLATVEPGTRFELEKAPVGDGAVWFPEHFSSRANAKILGVWNHREHEDNAFWDYQPAK